MKAIKDFFNIFSHKPAGFQEDDIHVKTNDEDTPPPLTEKQLLFANTTEKEDLTCFSLNSSTEQRLKEIEKSEVRELDNKESVPNSKLVKDLIDLIAEFDATLRNVADDEVRQILEMCQYRIMESLLNNGLSPIDSNATFDHLLHIPVPYSIVEDGTPIKEFKRIGLRDDCVVYLKAQVVVDESR